MREDDRRGKWTDPADACAVPLKYMDRVLKSTRAFGGSFTRIVSDAPTLFYLSGVNLTLVLLKEFSCFTVYEKFFGNPLNSFILF